MPATPCAAAVVRPSAAEVNAQIRVLCAGRSVWTPPALAELSRLLAEWRKAVAREAGTAA